jgi:two-component system chemotaxis response regulator CheY
MKDYKILVVDDFDTMVRIIKNILEDLNYTNIVTARNGEYAWQILNKEKVDFIISDWNMPKMTGLELLIKVKESSDFAHIPFLMVTAEAEQRHIMDAVKAKVNQYIIKPFTTEMLKEKIHLAIKSQEKILAEKKDA